MIILGINGGVRLGYQDVSAVLVRDGEVLAAVEEERLNRIKHSPGQWPYLSILEVLKIGKIDISEVDIVATHGSTWGDKYQEAVADYFKETFNHKPHIIRYPHHTCHAASTYYASGWANALIITVDSSGDGISLQIAAGNNGQIQVLEQITREDSLGMFYSMMTQFCGFNRDTDEYKLMGLAPYGDAKKIDLSFLIDIDANGYKLNQKYIHQIEPGQPQRTRQQSIYNDQLSLKLGRARLPHQEMTTFFMDVAASTQELLEEALLSVIQYWVKKSGLRNLCLAGGVALNCAANKRILEHGLIDHLFVQPASGDAGISLGAAWLASADNGSAPVPTPNTFLGNNFSNDDILAQIKACGIKYKTCSEPWETASGAILNNQVVGWMNGSAEFGPRALGNRSILASPYHPGMKDIINKKIKFREGFRPFCPSVLEEDFKSIFSSPANALPYMTINAQVIEKGYPAITHVDNTARVQTVPRNASSFSLLLQKIKEKSGKGILINTSFNRNKEPIINSPRDAISAFFGSGMDQLFIGPYQVLKDN